MQIKTTKRYHCSPDRKVIIKKKTTQEITSAGEDVERKEPSGALDLIPGQILHHWATWEAQVLQLLSFFKFYIFISTFYLKNFSPTEKYSGSSVYTLTPFLDSPVVN